MKIYNMLEKSFSDNSRANMNCILIFESNQEMIDHWGHYPRHLPKVTEAEIGPDVSKENIEIYLDMMEAREALERK